MSPSRHTSRTSAVASEATLLALEPRQRQLALRGLGLRLAEIGGEQRETLLIGVKRLLAAAAKPGSRGPFRMVLEEGGEASEARPMRIRPDRRPFERHACDFRRRRCRIGIPERRVALAVGGDGELRRIGIGGRDEGRQRGEGGVGVARHHARGFQIFRQQTRPRPAMIGVRARWSRNDEFRQGLVGVRVSLAIGKRQRDMGVDRRRNGRHRALTASQQIIDGRGGREWPS